MRATRTLAVVCGAVSSLVLGCGSSGGADASPPAEDVAAALPAGAVVIFDDALQSGWADWSWGSTRNFAATSPVASGTRSLSVTYSAWGALYLRRSGASSSGTTLSLKVNGGGNAGLKLAVVGVTGSTQLPRVDLATYCAAKAIPKRSWTQCQVPLSALGPAGTVFDGFQIEERNGKSHSAMYFDDIGLTGGAAAPTVPAAPANLAATPSTGAVSLSWSAVSGATGYDVSRATASAGPFTKLTASAQAATTYRDGAVTAGTTYWYRVVAVNAAGAGPACGAVSATVPAAQTVSISVSPASASADACGTVKFGAAVTGAADGSVTWSVQEGAAGGAIDAAGTYTAPSNAGTYHVVARSNAATAATATATVTVQERVVSVAVSPASASVAAGGQVQLAATVTTTCGTYAAQ